MKKFLLIAFVALCYTAVAQDIKVSKGQITADGKPLAKIEKGKGFYTISDLDGTSLFTAQLNGKTPLGNWDPVKWLQLTGTNGVVKEVSTDNIRVPFSLSIERYISQLVVLNPSGLVTVDGVNKEKIAAFFQTEDRSISSAYDSLTKVKETENNLAKQSNIKIDNAGNIFAGGQKIGFIIKKIDTSFAPNPTYIYTIADTNRMKVGILKFQGMEIDKNNGFGYPLATFDGKTFPVYSSYRDFPLSNDDLAKNAVYTLYVNGYTLGDMSQNSLYTSLQSEINEQNQAIVQKAKDNSPNLYDVPGYITDKDGNKIEGTITIEFESIDAKLGRGGNVSDLTSYGSSVTVKDAAGKTKSYKAKDGVKVYTDKGNFIGTSGTEDGGLGNNSGSQLSVFGGSLFFKVAYESNGNYVLFYVKNPEYFYLKLGNDKAVYLGDKASFGTKKPEKIKKIFDNYVKCPNLNFSDYNTATKEGLIQVITDYQQKCGK